jgi:hypothetical protein
MSASDPMRFPDPEAINSFFFGGNTRPMAELCHNLTCENQRLRDEMKKREADAYEHGLGDAAKVYRENRILTATIAALTDRQHPLTRIRP